MSREYTETELIAGDVRSILSDTEALLITVRKALDGIRNDLKVTKDMPLDFQNVLVTAQHDVVAARNTVSGQIKQLEAQQEMITRRFIQIGKNETSDDDTSNTH